MLNSPSLTLGEDQSQPPADEPFLMGRCHSLVDPLVHVAVFKEDLWALSCLLMTGPEDTLSLWHVSVLGTMPQSVGNLERDSIWKMGTKQVSGRKLDEKACGRSGTGHLRPRQIQRGGSYLLQKCMPRCRERSGESGMAMPERWRGIKGPGLYGEGLRHPGKETGNRCRACVWKALGPGPNGEQDGGFLLTSLQGRTSSGSQGRDPRQRRTQHRTTPTPSTLLGRNTVFMLKNVKSPWLGG